MDCEIHELFYIKEIELKLLLAGLGASGWYGIFSEKDVAEQELKQNFHQILAELYQKDVINFREDQVSIKKPYSDMFAIMLAQKKCVTFQTRNTEYPKRCCYIDQKGVVVTRKSQREEKTLVMEQMSVRDWIQFADEEIRRLENGEILSMICRNSRDGQEFDCIRICQKGIRAYLDDGVVYQKEALRERMEEWIAPNFPTDGKR